VRGTGGTFRRLDEHSLHIGIGGQRFFECFWFYGFAIRLLDQDGVQSVSFGDLGPSLAEFSGGADDDSIAGLKAIGH
jgi:hypothetical protein